MNKKSKFLQKEFGKKQEFIKELNVGEHIVFGLAIAIVNAIFIMNVINNYGKQSPYLTFGASLFNVCSVMSCAKKKPICQLYSLCASLILAPVAGIEHTYATMIMYGVNVVVAIVSLITGTNNSNKDANITPKSLTGGQILIHAIVVIGLITGFTFLEGLQSYQDFMSGIKGKEIPSWYLRMFDSAALMITLSLCIPLMLRLNIVLPLYLCLNVVQICTGSCVVAKDIYDFNSGIMIVNNLAFMAMNIFGLINGNKERFDKLNKSLKKKVA